jgi:REP element-mobilizing transposase RayT
MDKFNNKYRIPSARAQWWDYSEAGAYFVTICTDKRQHFFGEIVSAKLQATEFGLLAEKYWFEIPRQFNYTELGAFVVMPNHVHGILVINDLGHANVETRLIASLQAKSQTPGGITGTKNPMLHDNISRVIRWYKGRCTYEMRKIQAAFGWQSRFYDHIIRNDDEYLRICQYIESNPDNWEHDKLFNPDVAR